MEIPSKLKNQFFIKTNKKIPIEKEWNSKNNYTYDDIINISSKNDPYDSSYGIITGINNLVVIDCDDIKFQKELMKHRIFQDTFIVETAIRKLYHFYFYIKDHPENLNNLVKIKNKEFNIMNSFSIKEIDNRKTLADIKSFNGQIIGPNSTISGNKYNIVNNSEIKELSFEYLNTILKNINQSIKIHTLETKNIESKNNIIDFEYDETCQIIKDNISIEEILRELDDYEFKENENPTKCPFNHHSERNKCFSFHNNLYHCFNCEDSGNVIQLYQKLKNIPFAEAKNKLLEKLNMIESIEMEIMKMIDNKINISVILKKITDEIILILNPKTIRNDSTSEIWIYNNGEYIPEGGTFIEELCMNFFKDKYKSAYSTEVIKMIKTKTYIDDLDFFTNHLNYINLIPMYNNIYDFENDRIIPFDKKYIFFNKLPIIYNPSSKKPEKFINFLKDIFEEEENIDIIQELFGYLLYRKYSVIKCFIFNGDGQNGKSILLDIVSDFLSPRNLSYIGLQELSNERFARAELFNKAANTYADLPSSRIEDSSVIRTLTGNDTISADRKFIGKIKFKNFAKLIFSCNKIPEVKDQIPAFFQRWIILDFPYKFVENPDSNNPFEKKKISDIKKEIINSNELSAIFNWSIEGLKRLLKNTKFTDNVFSKDLVKGYNRKSNSFFSFVHDNLKLININGARNKDDILMENLQDNFIRISTINKAYSHYCINNKLRKISANFTKHRILEEFGSTAGFVKIGEMTARVYENIEFKKDSIFYNIKLNDNKEFDIYDMDISNKDSKNDEN